MICWPFLLTPFRGKLGVLSSVFAVLPVSALSLSHAPGIGTVWLVVVVSTGLGLGAGLLAGHYVEMPLLEWCKKRIAGLKLNTRTAVREA